jgi:Adenylate and Guanylate cyclase catalytic domain
VQIRVGLKAGEAVVRAIGNDLDMDYSAVSETTDLAARMEQVATPGSILLTAPTLRLGERLVRVAALGPAQSGASARSLRSFGGPGGGTRGGALLHHHCAMDGCEPQPDPPVVAGAAWGKATAVLTR